MGWGLVGGGPGRGDFRPNPIVDQVQTSSFQLTLQVDSRNRDSHPGRGWYATALFEAAGDYLESGPQFSRYLADLRRYQPLGRGMRLDLRLRLGALKDAYPRQYPL